VLGEVPARAVLLVDVWVPPDARVRLVAGALVGRVHAPGGVFALGDDGVTASCLDRAFGPTLRIFLEATARRRARVLDARRRNARTSGEEPLHALERTTAAARAAAHERVHLEQRRELLQRLLRPHRVLLAGVEDGRAEAQLRHRKALVVEGDHLRPSLSWGLGGAEGDATVFGREQA